MFTTVTQVITDAFNDSGIVARQFNQVQGSQLYEGLRWFNQILGDKAMDTGDIAYITMQYPMYGVVGQETYFIPNCISIDAITFYIGSVRYQMQFLNRAKYFGNNRANNINSLPLQYTYERVPGGIMLWVYFWPMAQYLFNITGNFFLQNVTLNQDLAVKQAVANLGTPIVTGAGTFAANELIINGVDLAGTYANIGQLINFINTGNKIIANPPPTPAPQIPFVTASLSGTDFILTCYSGDSILVQTLGTQSSTSNVTFSNFSTVNGFLYYTYYPMSLDQFYINYLEYELCERICEKYNISMPEGIASKLSSYRLQINNLSEPLDLTCGKYSPLSGSKAINYAQVNIGQGFSVSSY